MGRPNSILNTVPSVSFKAGEREWNPTHHDLTTVHDPEREVAASDCFLVKNLV